MTNRVGADNNLIDQHVAIDGSSILISIPTGHVIEEDEEVPATALHSGWDAAVLRRSVQG